MREPHLVKTWKNGAVQRCVTPWRFPTLAPVVRRLGHYRLIATDFDITGNSNGASVCNFTTSWSDCVNHLGDPYQLKPGSIQYFMKIAAGQDPAL